MAKKKSKKIFDCVEMKHKIQEKIAEETAGMNTEEIIQYFNQRIANSRFADLFPDTKTEAKGKAP